MMMMAPPARRAWMAAVAAAAVAAAYCAVIAQAQAGAPSSSSCAGVTYVNGTSSGAVSDGSGLERYKGQGNCTWVIDPESNPDGTIFVAIDDFRTVMGADSVYFLDGDTDTTFFGQNNMLIYGNPLAVLTGIIPTPHVMRFDAEDLRVQFISQGSDVREEGFSLRWWTDGSTCENLGACSGNGECVGGLCECAAGFAGGDCSLPVPALPVDGTVVSGELAVGATDYYTITVPDDGERYFLRVDMRSLGGVDADPMLMVANASASPNWMADYYFTPPQGSESVGPCGPAPGCHWCAYPVCDPGYDDPQISPLLSVAGPVTDYAHTSFGVDDAYPDPVNTRLMSLPTEQFHTFNDYESWDLKKPLHTIFLSNEASDKTELPPGDWVVGVTNSLPIKLVDLGEERFWGTDPGFSGATASAPYELSAVLSTSTNDTCQRGCSGNGECFNNECVCDGFAGPACEKPVASVPPGSSLRAEPLPAGEWAYYFVPLDSADISKRFFAEIAFPGSPDALPFLFVSRGSDGVPAEVVQCGNYWGSGPYGATHCEIVGFKSEAEAIDNPLETSGIDYHYVALEPESNIIGDGRIEDGFYVGVYNHPGHGDASLDYQLSMRFVDADSDPTCPFGCSGNGGCLPPFDPSSPIGVCECDDGFAGAYCNDEPVKISAGERVEAELASGDWAYYEFSPEAGGPTLVSLSKETDNIAKPLLFIKEGRFPSLTSTFSSEVSSVAVELDPGFNGVSIDQHTSAAAPGYADNGASRGHGRGEARRPPCDRPRPARA